MAEMSTDSVHKSGYNLRSCNTPENGDVMEPASTSENENDLHQVAQDEAPVSEVFTEQEGPVSDSVKATQMSNIVPDKPEMQTSSQQTDLETLLLKPNTDVRPKNRTNMRMPTQAQQDADAMWINAQEALSYLAPSQRFMQTVDQIDRMDSEVTYPHTVVPPSRPQPVQQLNQPLHPEFNRIRQNYRTLWQDNLSLQEENEMLQAQLESLKTPMPSVQATRVPVPVNTNVNANTRVYKPAKPVCSTCPDDIPVNPVPVTEPIPTYSDNDDEYGTDNESYYSSSSSDAHEEIRSEMKDINTKLNALIQTISNTNANAKENQPNRSQKRSNSDSQNYRKKTKKHKANVVCFAEDASSDEETDREIETEQIGRFSTKLRHFDPLGKEPWTDYLIHFKNCARAMNWPRKRWAIYLGTHLKGKAMKVYNQISEDKLADFDHVAEEIGKNTLNYEMVSRTKLNTAKIDMDEDFQVAMQKMELEAQLAYPDAPESFYSTVVKEKFMNALPIQVRDKLLPSASTYQSTTQLGMAAEETKNYLASAVKVGQVNVKQDNGSGQPKGKNKNYNKSFNGNQNNGFKNYNQNFSQNNNGQQNNGRRSSAPRPTEEQKEAMRGKICYRCGIMNHTANFCRTDFNRQRNGYQGNGYRGNNGYQGNGYQGNNYQNNGYQNNGFQNNGYQNNGYQNNGYQNRNNNNYQGGNRYNGSRYNGQNNYQGGYQGNQNQNEANINRVMTAEQVEESLSRMMRDVNFSNAPPNQEQHTAPPAVHEQLN